MKFSTALSALVALVFIACSDKAKNDTEASTADAAAADTVAAPTQAEFDAEMKKVFSSSILQNAQMQGSVAVASVTNPPSDPTYLSTGDKTNKLFAIETVRIFKDLPGLNTMTLTVRDGDATKMLMAWRDSIDAYYGIKSASMDWSAFTADHDNEQSRQAFVDRFVHDIPPP